MAGLLLDVRRQGVAFVVTLRGQLDGSTSAAFGQFLLENLPDNAGAVVLDVPNLTAVSSAGLRELLNLAKRLRRLGCKPAVVGMTPAVALAVEIAGFEPLFHRTRDLTSALWAVAPASKRRRGLMGRILGGRSGT